MKRESLGSKMLINSFMYCHYRYTYYSIHSHELGVGICVKQ
jgi:hypothetical protein